MTQKSEQEENPRHLMLTVLGRCPKDACYKLGNQTVKARLAPLGLFQLLPETERPHCVIALCTPEARSESLPILEEALRDRCQVKSIDVPAGDSQDDVKNYLSLAVGAVPLNVNIELTVDVTHGYRHFSFLTYLAVLYLVGLRGIRLRGAYYGLLRNGEPSPFLDLGPLLALPRWFHVLEVLRETGSALPMAVEIGKGNKNQTAQAIERELSEISSSYLSALPLELGQNVWKFCEQKLNPLRKLLEKEHHLPLAQEMVELLNQTLKPFALLKQPCGDNWKHEIALAKPELERQARIINDHFQRGSVATALGLLNEWTVSWVLCCQGRTDRWIDYKKVRGSAANLLHAIARVCHDCDLKNLLSDEQKKLGDFWGNLCELRNAHHHHGMRPQILARNRQRSVNLKNVQSYWETVLRNCPTFPLTLGKGPGGRVLVSPIGMRPGVLSSAIHACQADGQDPPTGCLVICSRETEGLIPEAVQQASFNGEIESLHLEDPFGGRVEIERVVKAARIHLLSADEVLVNVTGGTTLMGLVAEALAEAARRFARPVRRFGLIDRRAAADQDADPYQIGEPFWLDNAEVTDGNHD